MKINVVVVTYNRLQLLKENVEALQKQTYPIRKIFIVDNLSTDGTRDYLEGLANEEDRIHPILLPQNVGGAGGFCLGIKEAVMDGCDWVWVMDDDTIPDEDALANLALATELTPRVGFLASKVVWTDRTPHLMNFPAFAVRCKGQRLLNSFSQKCLPAFFISQATFVSLLVRAEAVEEVGLPISDFFIWHDDVEYTTRICSRGYDCFYVDNSVVVHKTAVNCSGHPQTIPVKDAWKFYYQARNTTYIKKQKECNYFYILFHVLNKYRRYMRRLNKRTDGNKASFKKYIVKGCWDGLFFNPPIEYLPNRKDKE